jgi:hypothetical protein
MRYAIPVSLTAIAIAALVQSVGVAGDAAKSATASRSAATRAQSNMSPGVGCLVAGDGWPYAASQSPLSTLYSISPPSSAGASPRLTGVPELVGLEWGPDGRLYADSSHVNPTPAPSYLLYKIDPATGAAVAVVQRD